MAKRLFLLLSFGLLAIIISPGFSNLTDTFVAEHLNFGAVQPTEINVERTQIQEIATTYSKPVDNGNTSPRPTEIQTAAYTASMRDHIGITGRNIDIVRVPNTTIDSGSHVNKYGSTFLYGHNSATVFGGLKNLGVGSVFSVTENGVTRNYRIAKIEIYEKNTANGRLQLSGAGNYMRRVANGVSSTGTQHSLSIMTCYGTSYGNGDASHRLVLFANAM